MLRPLLILFALLISLSLPLFIQTEQIREIRLQGFLPMTGSGFPVGGACLPAALMAVRQINEQPGLLDGYNLTLRWADSMCHPGKATFEMFRSLSEPPVKNILIGDACSVATEPTAQVSHLFNLTQISYTATSSNLSDRKRFPNFFQLDNPDHAVNPVKILMMREFGWRKVATINQAIEFHSKVIDHFVKTVKGTEITIITQELFNDDPARRVENLKKHDARIIVTAMYEDEAREMMCKAYQLGLYGPAIVWIFHNWYSYDWWRPRNDSDFPCTLEEMVKVTEGSFLMGSFVRNHIEERGIAGLTVSEFDELYRKEETYDPVNDKYYICAPFIYDSLWIAAVALNCTETRLRKIGHPKYLDEFTYQDSDINDIIMMCMSNLSMTGVSGRFQYKGEATPVTRNIMIERVLADERVLVGTYTSDNDVWTLQWLGGALRWEGGNIPRDSTILEREEMAIPRWMSTTVSVCSGMGILLALLCFLFTVVYRQHRVVKSSSPLLNAVFLVGCILSYSTMLLTATYTLDDVVCKARTVCMSLGFTLVVSVLFSKTWRVYQIFTLAKIQRQVSETTKKTVMRRQCINQTPAVKNTDLGQIDDEVKNVYSIGNDVEVRPYVWICFSVYDVYFSWAMYIAEGILLAFGAFMAWETKNVKTEISSDSRQVGICIYNTIVLSAFGLTVSLLLDDKVVIIYGVTSACVVLGTTLNQLIIYLSKILVVVRQRTVPDKNK